MVRHSGPPKIRSLKMFLVTFIDNGNFTKILFPGECIKRRNGHFVDIKVFLAWYKLKTDLLPFSIAWW